MQGPYPLRDRLHPTPRNSPSRMKPPRDILAAREIRLLLAAAAAAAFPADWQKAVQ